MRNLKRALSLALASVMLLGMMVVGTSAASVNDFTDVDEINNLEAVAITTGLGIFEGYTDGSFGPEKAVTRAEAAVVIAKILHGSDVNPSNLAGAGKFTDVPAWAEGYVNLVAALKIIEGRGAGIFDPNATVTTVEYTTMLLKALGYYVDAETALDGDWKLEVTSKANALGLYGDLELGMNAPLSREDVASLTFNALFAQRVAYNDYRGQYVKATDRDVVVTNGTIDPKNTLADNTFGLYVVEGIVTANGYTDEKLSKSVKSEAQTTVMFTEDTDLNQDGKAEYDEYETYDFEIGTDLDFIGHAVSVYYTIEKKAPVVFAIVDEATLVDYITYNTNSTKLAEAANNAGFKKNTILDVAESDYIVNYDFDTPADTATYGFGTTDAAIATAIDGKTLIVISNSGNYNVDYVIVLDQTLDIVEDIDDDDKDAIEYDLKLVGVDTIPTAAVEEDDYVIVTNIGRRGVYYAFGPANVYGAEITKLTGKTNANSDITKVTADGKDYTKSNVDPKSANLDEIVAFAAIETIGETTLVVDDYGKLIAIVEKKAAPNYAYVAEYGIRHSTSGLNTKDVLTAKVYFADGTSGIYEVDLSKSTALVYKNGVKLADSHIQLFPDDVKKALNGATLAPATIVDKSTEGTISNWSNKLLAARGLYNVTVSGEKVTIKTINTDVSATADDVDNVGTTTYNEAVKLVKAHSTLLTQINDNGVAKTVNVTTSAIKDANNNDAILYNNNNTVYFYIDCDANGKNLTVKTITGIKNAKGFTNGVNEYDGTKAADTGIQEAFATKAANRAVIDTMLITCVDLGDAANIYYHDLNDYSVTKVESGKYAVTYKVYDNKTGEASEVTYDNAGKYWSTVDAAKIFAQNNFDGWYTLGANDLVAYAAESDGTEKFAMQTKGTTTYITNDDANYDEYVDNLFGGQSKLGAILDQDSVIIVDICNSGLNSVSKLVRAIKATGADKGSVDISFTWNSAYETFVIFVTSYTPDATKAPGADDNNGYKMTKLTVYADQGFKVDLNANATAGDKFNVQVYTWSQESAKWALQADKTYTEAEGDNALTDGGVKLALSNGVTYKVVVDGMEFNEFVWTGAELNVTPAN